MEKLYFIWQSVQYWYLKHVFIFFFFAAGLYKYFLIIFCLSSNQWISNFTYRSWIKFCITFAYFWYNVFSCSNILIRRTCDFLTTIRRSTLLGSGPPFLPETFRRRAKTLFTFGAMAGSRTRVNCLEGSYANRYTVGWLLKKNYQKLLKH